MGMLRGVAFFSLGFGEGEGKVGVEEDWMEEGVAMELWLAGVLLEEIGLGFYGPGVRQYTEFAIA